MVRSLRLLKKQDERIGTEYEVIDSTDNLQIGKTTLPN